MLASMLRSLLVDREVPRSTPPSLQEHDEIQANQIEFQDVD